MSTKLTLEYPYCNDWKYGYLVKNKENRKTLILFNSKTDRSSTQYARYLLSVKLKRYLTKSETVDHIDNDKTNDCISNLQILSMKDNIIKCHKKSDIKMTCPICKISFSKSLTQLRGRKEKAYKNEIACSRSCGGKLSHITKSKK